MYTPEKQTPESVDIYRDFVHVGWNEEKYRGKLKMLQIAKDSGLTDVISTGDLPYLDANGNPTDVKTDTPNPDYNPLQTTTPTTGGSVEKRVYLFNDDATKEYKTITISPTDLSGTDETGWLQLAPDNTGAAGVYGATGEPLSMADVLDSNTGHPFWVKVTTPAGTLVQNKTDIGLKIDFDEYAV